MKAKEKIIYCPRCGKKVAVYDGRSSMNVQAKCSKCNKIIVFHPSTGEVSYSDVPKRTTCSGLRFY